MSERQQQFTEEFLEERRMEAERMEVEEEENEVIVAEGIAQQVIPTLRNAGDFGNRREV